MTPSNAGGFLFKSVVAAAGVGLAAYLLIELRSLIVPVAVAGLLAYVCRPLVAVLERYRVPRDVAIGLLLLLFVLSSLFIVNRIRAVVPTDIQAIELKVEVLHKINERYKALMGLDESLAKGNRLYRLVHRDLDPLVDRVNHELALTPEERATLFASRPRRPDASTASDRLLDHDRANRLTLKLRSRTALAEADAVGPWTPRGCPSADAGREEASRSAGRHPVHVVGSPSGLPVPAARYRRAQTRPSRDGFQPAVRTGANGHG